MVRGIQKDASFLCPTRLIYAWIRFLAVYKRQALYRHFTIVPQAEVTLEANPGTLTAEKLTEYRESGINRLSIGLQTADGGLLRALGRIHTYPVFEENYKLARTAGFSHINVDLMYGLPGQGLAQWRDTLERVTALAPEHISAYSLILEAVSYTHLWPRWDWRRRR